MSTETDVRDDLSGIRDQLKDLEDRIAPRETSGNDNKSGIQDNRNLMELLLKEGYEDFLLTDPKVVRKLTDKRIELLQKIKEEEVESVKELADETDRSWANVSNDLDLLAQEGFIEFERNGKQKKPVLRAQKIFVKPIEL